jgi:two-component system response regulator CpxR
MQTLNLRKQRESVLLVDPDSALCALVKKCLEREGLKVEPVHDGQKGLDRALSGDHTIAILDIILPGLNGFELLRRVRAKSQIPVVIATARTEEVDRIIALEVGADDYITKPFNPRELIARLRAVLRRVHARSFDRPLSSHRIVVADIEMDTSSRSVFRAGAPVALTTAEFNLLQVLLRNAGRAVTREDLAQSALGRQFSPLDRSIDLHVSHLRRKLGRDSGGPLRIKAIRGIGYLCALPVDRQHRLPPAPGPRLI